MLENAQRLDSSSAWTRRVEATGRKYSEWCASTHSRNWPPTYEVVAGFLCEHVTQNQGSTRSLHNLLSQLRVFGRKHGLGWLDEPDTYLLRRTVATLCFSDARASKAKAPATLSVLRRVWRSLDPKQLDHRLFALTVAVGHNGLLRGAELHGGIRAGNFTWLPGDREVQLHLDRTKTHRTGPPVVVSYCRYEGLCAYRILKRWFTEHRLWTHPEAFVFPKIVRRKGQVSVDFSEPLSRATWDRELKRHFAAAGLDPSQYSGHSLRAGGATDLFTAGTPYPVIKKAGRWKSDAALQYFRARDHVAEEVAAAFGRQFRNVRVNESKGAGVDR